MDQKDSLFLLTEKTQNILTISKHQTETGNFEKVSNSSFPESLQTKPAFRITKPKLWTTLSAC